MNNVPLPQEFDSRDIDWHDDLTPLQNAYVHWRRQGFTGIQSAKRAGYSEPKQSHRENARNPLIKRLVTEGEEELRVRFKVDRDRVVEGIMEALSVAREQSDAKIMLQAWTDVARITGVQAPEVKRVEMEAHTQVDHHHITHASDRELLELIGRERELDILRPAIEGEYALLESDNEEEEAYVDEQPLEERE